MILAQIETGHLKLIAASGTAIVVTLADAVQQAASQYESVGLKAVLIAAVLYLVRELAKQRETDKAEAKERERTLIETVNASTVAKQEQAAAMQELKGAIETQTGYFRTVAQTLLSREIKPKLPE